VAGVLGGGACILDGAVVVGGGVGVGVDVVWVRCGVVWCGFGGVWFGCWRRAVGLEMEKGGCVVGLEIGRWKEVRLSPGREGVLWEGTIGLPGLRR
jgi:hypothetical protein